MKSSDKATILSLTAQVEEWKERCASKEAQLMTTRTDLDQLRRELEISHTRFAELQQKLNSEVEEWQELNATKAAELADARAELSQLRGDLFFSCTKSWAVSRSAMMLESKISHAETCAYPGENALASFRSRIVATKPDDKAIISFLTAQVEEWKEKCTSKEVELMAARTNLNELRRELEISYTRSAELKRELTSQIEQLRELWVFKMEELTAVRAEIEGLKRSR